jgi:hypothetical protein
MYYKGVVPKGTNLRKKNGKLSADSLLRPATHEHGKCFCTIHSRYGRSLAFFLVHPAQKILALPSIVTHNNPVIALSFPCPAGLRRWFNEPQTIKSCLIGNATY